MVPRQPFDPAPALAHLARVDPPLGRLIARVGEFRLESRDLPSTYEALGHALLRQQITGRAAAAIQARLQAHLGDPDRFPDPARIQRASLEELRAGGLSRNKALALQDLAARTRAGEVPDLAALAGMEDEAIVEALTPVRGIGRWTVEMLLIFRLGRPDVLPATDLGIRQGFGRTFRTRALPEPKAILARGERWRPWRTVASWYLWRALEL